MHYDHIVGSQSLRTSTTEFFGDPNFKPARLFKSLLQ